MDMITDPIFIQDAALFADGCWQIPVRGEYRALRERTGAIVGGFMEGWRADTLYNGFASYPILQLRSSTLFGVRILNTEAGCLGDCIEQLTPMDAARFRKQVLHVLGPLFRSLLHDERPVISPEAAAFLGLDPSITFRIAVIVQQELVADPVTLAAQDLAEVITINSCHDGRPVPLDPMRIQRDLALDFQLKIAQAPDGILQWPSPVDGLPVSVQGSICFSDMAIAYRFHDHRHGITFFLIAAGEHSRPEGFYLPQLDLFIAPSPDMVTSTASLMGCNISPSLIHAICRHGLDIIPSLHRGASRMVNLMRSPPWTHMAHQLWNELSGMEHFLMNAPPGTPLPETIGPCGAPGMELYGPVDELFPEWTGRVTREIRNPEAAMRYGYRSDGCVVRVTNHYVSKNLRARLQRYAISSCDCLDRVQTFRTMKEDRLSRKPIIMIGLRVENRTHHDLGGLLVRLLSRIAENFPGAVAILDGHNTRVGANGRMIESHGEAVASEHPAEVERKLVSQLRERLADVDIQIHDTIGQSMSNSLAISTVSDCFFAIWGACLAKFRWVANKPGIALTSRTNILHRGDLRIYHTPENMESPTRMVIPDPGWVHDLPEAPILMNPNPGQSRFFNFKIDEELVFNTMIDIIHASIR